MVGIILKFPNQLIGEENPPITKQKPAHKRPLNEVTKRPDVQQHQPCSPFMPLCRFDKKLFLCC